jgi:glycosyltransferase involved in cell wall biosynthesis
VRILYTGLFYGSHSPRPFFEVVARAGVGNVVLEIAGDPSGAAVDLRSAPLPVRYIGRVPWADSVHRMRDADFLLISLGEQARGNVPGKMFEYAASGRPILAVVPGDSVVARWVRETRTGFVIPWDDPGAPAAMRDLLVRYRSRALEWQPDAAALARYSADRSAEELDRILRSVLR